MYNEEVLSHTQIHNKKLINSIKMVKPSFLILIKYQWNYLTELSTAIFLLVKLAIKFSVYNLIFKKKLFILLKLIFFSI